MEDLYALTSQIMGNREYMFIAYDFETMVQMRKVLDDNATTSTNVKLQHVTNNPDQGMINYYKKRKIELDANCDKISLSDIKAFKDGGVNVGLWTVDDTERVASYISQKVDYITTNTKSGNIKRIYRKETANVIFVVSFFRVIVYGIIKRKLCL